MAVKFSINASRTGVNMARSGSSSSSVGISSGRSAKYRETASNDIGLVPDLNPAPSSNTARPTNFMTSYGLAHNTLFQGILPTDESSLLPYYRDIHDFDPIGGSAIEITSMFPWSNYGLVGLPPEELAIYKESMSRLNIRALMTDATTDYLCDGAWIATPLYSSELNNYVDIAVHDRMDVSISRRPTYSIDPAIRLNQSSGLIDFYAHSPFAEDIFKYSSKLVDVFRNDSVTLDPITTIYVPRQSNKNNPTVSYLRRMLPAYIYEKLVYRASLIETSKRMRSTTHIQMGSTEWIATTSEMQNVLEQFQLSELDPMGGWVVTRDGISVGEVRSPGDALKWTDVIDQLVPTKLRALGISEAFLSRESNFSNTETALAVFMESLGALREYMTFRIFTNKLFPLIALRRGLVRDASKLREMTSLPGLMANLSDYSNLKIPALHWNKGLRNADSGQLDILNTAKEKGLPIPLQMWASAANLDLGVILGGLETDEDVYKEITRITGKDPRKVQEESAENAAMDGGGGEWAGRQHNKPLRSYLDTKREALKKRPALADRDYGILGQPDIAYGKSGKLTKLSQGDVTKRQNMMHQAMKRLQDPVNYDIIRSQIKGRFTNPLTGS